MAKKRKIGPKPSQILQPPKQSEEEEEKEQSIEADPEEFEGEEEVEYEEVEYEEEVEESVEERDDGGEEGEDSEGEDDGEADPDNEPLSSLLTSFSKESLIILLSEAAERHPDVAAKARESAEADPSQRKIFVHGLNWDTTTATLMEEFKKYGEIVDCRVIPNKTSGKSKGYGFIIFKSTHGARKALKEPKKIIDERVTSCQLASVGSVPQHKLSDHQPMVYEPESTQRKIYVSNVGENIDPMKLTAFFSRYGEIEEGPLGLDKETGKPKGFCLFVYKTVESSKKALAEPHKQFEGVTLHCQKAIDGPKPHKKQMIESLKNHKNVTRSQHFDKSLAPNFASSTALPAAVPGNLISPLVQQPQQGLGMDPSALEQALTTLIAAQGAGLNLFGAFGAVSPGTGMVNNHAVVPSLGNQLVHGGYGNQIAGINGQSNTGMNGVGGYGSQGWYPNQQTGRGGARRFQRGGRSFRG